MRSASWHGLGTAAFSEGAAALTKAALGSSLCLLLRTAFEALAVLRGRGDASCPGGEKGCADRLESLRGVIGGQQRPLVLTACSCHFANHLYVLYILTCAS